MANSSVYFTQKFMLSSEKCDLASVPSSPLECSEWAHFSTRDQGWYTIHNWHHWHSSSSTIFIFRMMKWAMWEGKKKKNSRSGRTRRQKKSGKTFNISCEVCGGITREQKLKIYDFMSYKYLKWKLFLHVRYSPFHLPVNFFFSVLLERGGGSETEQNE